jgi:hypothetical protein
MSLLVPLVPVSDHHSPDKYEHEGLGKYSPPIPEVGGELPLIKRDRNATIAGSQPLINPCKSLLLPDMTQLGLEFQYVKWWPNY